MLSKNIDTIQPNLNALSSNVNNKIGPVMLELVRLYKASSSGILL